MMNRKSGICLLVLTFLEFVFTGCTESHTEDVVPVNEICRKEYSYDNSEFGKLDVITSKNVDTSVLRPVLVYIHGGGWNRGDKSEWNEKAAWYFYENGFISVSVNYALSPDPAELQNESRIKHPRHIHDVAKALEWVFDNIRMLGGDPDKIFLIGYSAGTYLADMLVINQQFLKEVGIPVRSILGVINLDAGPYITMDYDMWINQLSPIYDPELRYLWENAFGTNNLFNKELILIEHIDKNKYLPPFLLYYQNKIIRSKGNRDFAKCLIKNGVNCDTISMNNFVHIDFINQLGQNSTYSQTVLAFIQKYGLKK